MELHHVGEKLLVDLFPGPAQPGGDLELGVGLLVLE